MSSLIRTAPGAGAAMEQLLSLLFAFAEVDENEPTSSSKEISEQNVFMLGAGGFAGRRIFWSRSEPGTKLQVLSFSSAFTTSSKQSRLAAIMQCK
jgi:hypothetical protein